MQNKKKKKKKKLLDSFDIPLLGHLKCQAMNLALPEQVLPGWDSPLGSEKSTHLDLFYT